MYSSSKRKISWNFQDFMSVSSTPSKENLNDNIPIISASKPFIHQQLFPIEEEKQLFESAPKKKISLFNISSPNIMMSQQKFQIHQEHKNPDQMLAEMLSNWDSKNSVTQQYENEIQSNFLMLKKSMQNQLDQLKSELEEKQQILNSQYSNENNQFEAIQKQQEESTEEISSGHIRNIVVSMMGFKLENLKYLSNLAYQLDFVFIYHKIKVTLICSVQIKDFKSINRDAKEFETLFKVFLFDLNQNQMGITQIEVKSLRKFDQNKRFSKIKIGEIQLKHRYENKILTMNKLSQLLNWTASNFYQLEKMQNDLEYIEQVWGCNYQFMNDKSLRVIFGVNFNFNQDLEQVSKIRQKQEIIDRINRRVYIVFNIDIVSWEININHEISYLNLLPNLLSESDLNRIENLMNKCQLDQSLILDESTQQSDQQDYDVRNQMQIGVSIQAEERIKNVKSLKELIFRVANIEIY